MSGGTAGYLPYVYIEEQNTILKNSSKENVIADSKKCPFCAENIKNEAIICPHCGKNIKQYEDDERTKLQEEKLKHETEMNEKYKSIEDIFSDTNIMEEAKKLRRLYGQGVYIAHLKNKAKELGLGDIDINENDLK